MLHELWVCPDGLDTFCLAGPKGDRARSFLPANSTKVWVVDANCHFDAMTKYYEYRDWGEYQTDFPEQDKAPY